MPTWSPSLSVGVDWIDDQHKELFDRINKLLDAMRSGQGDKEIAPIIKFLEEYVRNHFREEEKIMTKYKHPKLDAHKEQHISFNEKFKEMQKLYKEQGSSTKIVLEIQKMMNEWWVNHINRVDKALGAFLKDKV